MHLIADKKSRKRSGFVSYSYSQADSEFTAVKGGTICQMKGIMKRNRKMVKTVKNGIKRVSTVIFRELS